MITRLKELKQTLKDGQAEALVLSPQTLYDILHEIENMCVTTNTIEAKPVDNNGPGFWLHARGTTLFYIVQNGTLMAGYIPYVDDPTAPGL